MGAIAPKLHRDSNTYPSLLPTGLISRNSILDNKHLMSSNFSIFCQKKPKFQGKQIHNFSCSIRVRSISGFKVRRYVF
jgi:hypothetical protein